MGRLSLSNRNVQAELAIQYKGSKARSIVHTSRNAWSTKEKDQILSSLADLRALDLIHGELFPSRYDVAWKHGQVRVGWRVSDNSVSVAEPHALCLLLIAYQYEHRRLQYDIRQADEKLQDVMVRREMYVIKPVVYTCL